MVKNRQEIKNELLNRGAAVLLLEYHDYDDLVECEGVEQFLIEDLLLEIVNE
jgi:hypothetical protein